MNLKIVKKPKISLTTTWNVLGRECYSSNCVAIRTARVECSHGRHYNFAELATENCLWKCNKIEFMTCLLRKMKNIQIDWNLKNRMNELWNTFKKLKKKQGLVIKKGFCFFV